MLEYPLQVKDLVHGYIGFTDLEQRVIDHPLFQRLRNVRQADVAYYVFPSSNISRFEHLLGACHVAGAMAENLTRSQGWPEYLHELEVSENIGISTNDQFVQTARLYALVHDIGHLPFSHLFERSLEVYAQVRNISMRALVRDWFGETDFDHPHEVYGALLIRRIVQDIPDMEDSVRRTLLRLMTEKQLEANDLLNPLKLLVDSSVDADRIDFVARDGLLAGGEYGTHDIDRLTSSVFLHKDVPQDGQDGTWKVMYSIRALGSLEALMFDRYRTYTWINFHDRVVATKLIARLLIRTLLERGYITREHFQGDNDALSWRNDIWLWGLINCLHPGGDETIAVAKQALLQRRKEYTLNIWKDRPIYEYWYDQMLRQAGLTEIDCRSDLPEEEYGKYLTDRLGITALVFYTAFNPVGNTAIRIYDERNRVPLDNKHLLEVSELVSSLPAIWDREPQFYVLLLGDVRSRTLQEWQEAWRDVTAQYLRRRR